MHYFFKKEIRRKSIETMNTVVPGIASRETLL